ncbi:MAG: hypothetical protein P4M11_09145, partial [Candidatus Pacebacteria bacterium]|nr:hypothetical protein [Candidatus Paceibacterota bacterium]
ATMLCTRSDTGTTRDTSVRRPLVSSSTLMRMGAGPVRTCDEIQFKRVLSAISGRIGLILLDSCCHRSGHARCEDAWIDGGHGGDRGTGPARSVGRLEEPPGGACGAPPRAHTTVSAHDHDARASCAHHPLDAATDEPRCAGAGQHAKARLGGRDSVRAREK